MYHRVADAGSDPWGLCVTPTHFEEHLQVLRQSTRVVSLREFARRAVRGALDRDAVVITFDDGYADNFYAAVPLLKRYDLSATFFITTGESQREFWWDELDRLLLQPSTLPGNIRLAVAGDEIEWSMSHAAQYSRASFVANKGWSAWDEPPTPRHALYVDLWHRLYPLPYADKWDALTMLASQLAVKPAVRASHQTLSDLQIAELGRSPLCEIGAHTVTHPALPTLDVCSQREEIEQSKKRLEHVVGRSIEGFSYPHGAFTPETVDLVRTAGFGYACAADGGPLTSGADPLTLPRLMVPNVAGDEFARWLDVHETAVAV